MSVKERAKNQIFNILEWIVNIIMVCLAMTQYCSGTLRSQFINFSIFGYFIVNSLVTIAIFIENQEFTKSWKYIFCSCGIFLFLSTSALIFEYVSRYNFEANHNVIMTVIAVLAIIMVILYIVEIIYVYKNKQFQI